ncbi:hypothetical protein MLD63_01785 (plasmid) [Paracoccus sp. TK19116]|uniref:Tat pathway signal protein n=1 Tax=Paracoccus albicereus TaxID=2922394 RepID=A0ABT1MQF8_9RHOB|nr:hypothetical protein [Paracoccus albicereus]MCQ0969166.1 hypothetical protein [Paracoccus albicereus]
MAVLARCKLAALTFLLATAPAMAQVEAPADDGSGDAAATQDAGRIVLELNGATDTDAGACRMTFVATNDSGEAFERTAWQVGVFDGEGIVRSILVLEFGALSDGKTKIVLFDLPGSGCADISRVVVNDVAQCQPEGAAETELADTCLDALSTRSRTELDFGI